MQKIGIVVPCYNEAGRLCSNEFISFLETNPEISLLFVNDGSSDDTLPILIKLTEYDSDRIKVLNFDDNKGKAEAVRVGVLKAKEILNSDILGFVDADLSTPLEQISILLANFNTDTLFVFGSRFQRLGSKIQRKWYRHLLGRIFATFASKLIRIKVYDTQCGAKFFKREIINHLFEHPFITNWIFDVELFLRLNSYSNVKIEDVAKEIPINEWFDVQGSKLKLIDFLRIPFELYKLFKSYKVIK